MKRQAAPSHPWLPAVGMILSFVVPGVTNADFAYFDWGPGPIETGDTAVAHGITATITVLGSAETVDTISIAATNPDYVSQYGSPLKALRFESVFSERVRVDFSQPLPEGSRLLAIDIDAATTSGLESVTLQDGTLSPLPNFIDQLETIAGETSLFPTYDASTGVLSAVDGVSDNIREATVFDISGANAIYVTTNHRASGVGFGTVPEPSAYVLWLIAAAGYIVCWKTKGRRRS